jgi:hypothetical protein
MSTIIPSFRTSYAKSAIVVLLVTLSTGAVLLARADQSIPAAPGAKETVEAVIRNCSCSDTLRVNDWRCDWPCDVIYFD